MPGPPGQSPSKRDNIMATKPRNPPSGMMARPDDGGSIPAQPRQVPDVAEPTEETFTVEDMQQQGAYAADLSRKETILKLLYQEKMAANAPIVVTDTLLLIMADYKFVELVPEGEGQETA